MNKKEISLSLILEMYLLLDIIILSGLCFIEYKYINHEIVLGISFALEFLTIIYIANKSNIKSTLLFYVLLLVSPIFLGLIAMAVAYISGKTPFTATMIVLFRNGFCLNGKLTNTLTRILIFFRIPALIGIMISILTNYVNKKTKKISEALKA